MDTTALVVTICVISLGIYDLCAVLYSGVGTSVSRFLQRTALKSPVIAFTFGFVCGHLWGYMAPECPNEIKKVEEARIESSPSVQTQELKQ